ncbi:SMI1/KNR4 family protein [Archangium gephyra]|uniref:SMI1/KNR4 family protein n=1 Tax=Archangium gephyra TaxID=48 RepID=UPI003B819799
MTVQWIPRVWKIARHATAHEVEALERAWGVELPEDYKRVAMMHQGMAPEPCVLDTDRGNVVMSELLLISESEEFRAYSMSDTYKLIHPYVPVGVYPFASTANGDFLCFDYRGSPSAPRVVFYFTEASGEEAIEPVAEDFTHLLSRLHD